MGGEVSGDSRAADRLLHEAMREGVRAYGALPMPFPEFRDLALDLAGRRIRRAGGVPDPGAIAAQLARSVLRDLFLTAACDAGIPGAWESFQRQFGPRIRSLAFRQGATAEQAESLAGELGGALILPPARGGARTRLGTFDGTGSLCAWLAIIVAHRLADLRRSPRAISLDALLDRGESNSRPGRTLPPSTESDPAKSAEEGEEAGAVAAALERAIAGLSERERDAILARYADGLSQEEVARRLGVGSPRVSRLLSRAHEKLRVAVAEGNGGGRNGHLRPVDWTSLRNALGARLAALRSAGTAPSGEDPGHA